MTTRRRIINVMLVCMTFFLTPLDRLGRGVSLAWSKTLKRIVNKGTPMASLMHADPADFDTSALEMTPIQEFDVMGKTAHPVDLQIWRLKMSAMHATSAFLD